MTENGKIREAVEAVVAEAFDSHVRSLHDEIVTRVMERVEPMLRSSKQASSALKSCIAAIESSAQQTHILRALLDNSALFARRTALFVLRGTSAVGWQARGFEDNEEVRAISVDATMGLAGSVVQQRCTVIGPAASFDQRLSPQIGVPLGTDCAVMPLVIRDRVAAVLYIDGSHEGTDRPDVPAVEILVHAAGLWIEVQALRQTSGTGTPAPRPGVQTTFEASTPAAPALAHSVPVQPGAGITYHNTETRPNPDAVAATKHKQTDSQQNQHGTNRMDQSAGIAKETAPPTAIRNPENDESHKKARRFAKLLVDEIMLYNRDKVVEGRSQRDLYDRLKDDIDKSRAMYDRRYAETQVAPHDYFTQALISGLAEDKAELLGPNFAQRRVETV